MKSFGLAPQALADLASIADYIAKDDPRRALTFVDDVQAKARHAAEGPRSYRERSDIAPGLRSAVHGRYVIFFRELDHEVRVERIVHGARDLRKLTIG